MTAHSSMIMLIVTLLIASLGVFAYFSQAQSVEVAPVLDSASPRIISVIADNVSSNSAQYVRISVTSDRPVRINDSLIILSESSQATLAYRDGVLERNISSGFFTQ